MRSLFSDYFDKEERILILAKARRALHLGCVGFTDLPTEDRIRLAKQSLHYELTRVSDVMGLDYSREAITFFRNNAIFNNVVFGNAEKLDEAEIKGKFELIIVGDIIEHLSNPGLMLDGLKLFCEPWTTIVVTTPHSFGLLNFIRFVFGRFMEGKEHVMSFNAMNLINLFLRHGYSVESIDTCYQRDAARKGLLFHVLRRFFYLFPRFGGTLFLTARLRGAAPDCSQCNPNAQIRDQQ